MGRLRLAILFHFGNHSMYQEFRRYLNNIYATSHDIDIYISYQVYTPLLEELKKNYQNVTTIQTVLGMDIGGKLMSFSQAFNNKKTYDYFLSLHTKSDVRWRMGMILPLCGSSEIIQKCLDIFQSDQNIGIISSQEYTYHISHYNINHPIQQNFCQKWNLSYQGNQSSIHFVGGTIFWMRWSIIERFISERNIDIIAEYKTLEPGHVRNSGPTNTHSWERMFGIISYHYGKHIHPINIQSLGSIHPRYYIAKYPDLPAHGIANEGQAIDHYLRHGFLEGRSGNLSKEFDAELYLRKYPELEQRGIKTKEQAITHFLQFGIKEGKTSVPINKINL